MATWNLTIDNRNNISTVVYVMEEDELGLITSPDEIFDKLCFNRDLCNSDLSKRFYKSLIIGGANFPPICREIAGRGNETLVVAENTKGLRVWTYKDNTFTARENIREGIKKDGVITIPTYR